MPLTNLNPAAWIDGWTYDGTDIVIPRASLPELSAAEAHPDTGSFPNFLYALLHAVYAQWALVAAADRPANMALFRSLSTDPATLVTEDTFTVRLNTSAAAGSINVVPETSESGS